MTPGGELNHKQIRLDFDATEWFFSFWNRFFALFAKCSLIRWQNVYVSAVTHLLSPKNPQALGRVMWRRNVPNSAYFMVYNKIYAVFHVFGCFKFKVTFYNVFSFKWVLMSILTWNGFLEYQNRKKSMIIFGNRTC